MHVDPPYVDIARSVYTNAFEFGPHEFATGGVSQPSNSPPPNRTWGAGRTCIGLCSKFLVSPIFYPLTPLCIKLFVEGVSCLGALVAAGYLFWFHLFIYSVYFASSLRFVCCHHHRHRQPWAQCPLVSDAIVTIAAHRCLSRAAWLNSCRVAAHHCSMPSDHSR